MAHGFLQSFNSNISVFSGGTDPAPSINRNAVGVMKEAGVDISHHTPMHVDNYLNEPWDYVITVCDDANETCPVFSGKVSCRMHIGFEDPSKATGSDEYIMSEFRRVRDEIHIKFREFYVNSLS